MTRSIWMALAALAGLALLAGCGAGDPPQVQGGMDLSNFWAAKL